MYMYDVKIDPSVTDTANPSGRTMRGGGSRVWHDVKSGIPLRVYFVCSFIAFNGQIHTYTTSTAAANSLAFLYPLDDFHNDDVALFHKGLEMMLLPIFACVSRRPRGH